MKKTTNNRNLMRIGAVLVLSAFWILMPFLLNGKTVQADELASSDTTIAATLAGAAINGVTPSGYSEHRTDNGSSRRRMTVQVSSVNLAAGTTLTVFVNNASIGQFNTDNFGNGFFSIDTNNGQNVPVVVNGNPIAVRAGSTDIVAGVFGTVTATPSPSVSPSGSPNPSPSGSPNPSPSGSPNPSPSASPTGSPNPSPSASPTGSPSPSPSGSPNPSPSVSPSPTGSPSPSPSGSPSPSPSGSPSPNPSPNGGDLFAPLSGSTTGGVLPSGLAQYEIHSSRTELEINVRQVNLPAGSALSVTVNNIAVGNLIVQSDGTGRLRLRSDRGENVPVVTAGTPVVLRNGAATVLAGTFAGFSASPSPSPSPSGSPSPSPSGSPNPSPSPSPSPSQGRFFEAHLTGSGTAATGEVKIFLNADETQATITGEFHNLSSAQTGARIEVLAGTISTAFAFPTIGGTNGNFPTTTIAINSIQVAQLRTGLWSAVITTVNNPSGEVRGQLTTHNNSSDFDGDGSTDIAVFRPGAGTFYTLNSQGIGAQVLGGANDKLISGDYDGDGRTDAAVFQNQNGTGVWTVKRSSDGGVSTMQFGFASDTPVRGDFDGDGRIDLAVYRSSTGTWFIQRSNNSGFVGVQFGASEDVPVASDFDGDGKADIAVWRPSNGVWYWIRSTDGGIGAIQFGQAGDVPVGGDFDGDGKTDVSVFRPNGGLWCVRNSATGTYDFRQFGLSDDVPVAGNYDGDNRTDIAVFRPSNGFWYIWRSADGTFDYRQFGQVGDVPTPVR